MSTLDQTRRIRRALTRGVQLTLPLALGFIASACGARGDPTGSGADSTRPPAVSSARKSALARAPTRGAEAPATSSEASRAATYTFEFFDGLPEARSTQAIGLNDLGTAVGQYLDTARHLHGFVRRGRTLSTVDVPFAGAVGTDWRSVNDLGVVVGGWGDQDFFVHGAILGPGGAITRFDYPGAAETYPGAINNRGEIVGSFDQGDFTGTGFLYRRGSFSTLANPSGAAPDQNYPYGINDTGLVVGQYLDPNFDSHGYVLRGGTYTTVDYPGAIYTQLNGVNDLGRAVGVSVSSAGEVFGFVVGTRQLHFAALTCPGGLFTEPYAINNRGQIAGACRNSATGPLRAFIATPTNDDVSDD